MSTIAEALYLFVHGDRLDTYPGWEKRGKMWIREEDDGIQQTRISEGAGSSGCCDSSSE
jgi:hypothetical protein